MKLRGRMLAAATALIAGAGPAFAAVDEIVVTAQRREQALQDVPLAVSAFDASAIDQLQIDVIKDIGQNVPNLQTYTVTAGAQAIQVHSRGASVQNPGFNASESPVGIYQDDVYFGRLASANLELSDIERIEVLRGPQGTLYGRNTIAGAIKVVSRTPGDDAWFNGSAGFGNFDTLKLTSSVGGPLADGALAGSVSLLWEDRNSGWQDNPLTSQSVGEHENLVARGKLHWYGSERFDAVLTVWAADLENDGYNGVPYESFPAPNGQETGGPLGELIPGGDFYSNLSPPGVGYGESDQVGASLNLAFEFGDVTLRSITAFGTIDDRFGFDLAGGGSFGIPGLPGVLIASESDVDTLSEELQLAGSAFDGGLEWITGLYFQTEDGDQTFGGTALPFVNFVENIETDTDSVAVFAEGTWQFSDRWSLVAGGRWTRDDKQISNRCTGATCIPDPVQGFDVSLDESFDEFTGKLGVNFEINDDLLAYATLSQGFQAGGFQTLCLGDMTCANNVYDAQTVDSIDAGIKMELADGKLRLNVAGFYAMYDDIQQTALSCVEGEDEEPVCSFPLQNVGEVDVYGLEAEFTWSPTDSLSVFGFLGLQKSDYGSLNPGASAGPDFELPSNPERQGKLGFSYALPATDRLEAFYGADLYYTDEYYSTVDNALLIDDYSRLNAYLGLREPDGHWQVVLSGRNVTDEEDNVSGISFPGFGVNIRTPLPPAEYMLTFKLNY